MTLQQYIQNRKSFTLLLDSDKFILRSFMTNLAKDYFKINNTNDIVGIVNHLYLYNIKGSNELNDNPIALMISPIYTLDEHSEANRIVLIIDNLDNMNNPEGDNYYDYVNNVFKTFEHVFAITNNGNKGVSQIILRDNNESLLYHPTGAVIEQNKTYIYNTDIVHNSIYIPLPAVIHEDHIDSLKKFNTGSYIIATLYAIKNDLNKMIKYVSLNLIKTKLLS